MRLGRQVAQWPVGSVPFYLLLVFSCLLPMPFGAVYQWSWASFSIIVAILLGRSAISMAADKESLRPVLRGLWAPGGLYLIVAVWIGYQGLDTFLGHPLWDRTSEVLDKDVRQSISLDPYRSGSELLRFLTLGGVFWLAVFYGRQRVRAMRALWIVALVSVGYALYGFVAKYTDLGTHLWFQRMPDVSSLRSTFVNRNFYANYVGFGVLVALALLLDRVGQLLQSSRSQRARLKSLARGDDSLFLGLIVGVLIMVAALFLTASRGGSMSVLVAIVCLVVALDRRAEINLSGRRTVVGFLCIIFTLLMAGYVIAGGDLGLRLEEPSIAQHEDRIQGYELLLQAIRDEPLTGFGAGSARDVFYLYNDGRFWLTFNYPHSHYLGLAVEIGLPATFAFLTCLFCIGLTCLKGVRRRRRDQVVPALGVSILALVGVHGFVDSPLLLMANGAMFSFLLGLAYAQAWPTPPLTSTVRTSLELDQARETLLDSHEVHNG